jgi:uroporphyrinogen decarboxylase
MSGPIQPMLRGAEHILQSMEGKPGFIFNLGHGITPSAQVENMHALVEYVHTYPLKI